MRRIRIGWLMLVVIAIIQLCVLVLESNKLQTVSRKKLKNRRILGGHTVHSSGTYLIQRFFKSEGFPMNSMNPEDITLATHCSVDRLHHLIDIIDAWDGPMSISIYAPGDDAAFAEDAIDGFRLCWPKLRRTTTFHLLYPNDIAMSANMTRVGSFAYYSCKDITRKIYQRSGRMTADSEARGYFSDISRYPHNILRNLAMDGVLTKFALSIDIDLVPNKNLRINFLTFVKNTSTQRKRIYGDSSDSSRKTVYILPAFEVKESSGSRLITKKDILRLVETSEARILLEETCVQCHRSTNYEAWSSTPEDGEVNLGISHEVAFTRGWEPYFISHRDIPRYDENMVRYGYDRLSQICELNARKYTFSVLRSSYLARRSFTTTRNIPKKAKLRSDDISKFHKLFQQRLRQSGKLAETAVTFC